ncbi:MAG TPA: hypothetical protein VM580_12355, partial [Labilithrix sp.]|nr:hypothetical protein [Labilithrix sp.]
NMEAVRTALTLEEAFKSLGIGRLPKKAAARAETTAAVRHSSSAGSSRESDGGDSHNDMGI